jgi:hypothetical protein
MIATGFRYQVADGQAFSNLTFQCEACIAAAGKQALIVNCAVNPERRRTARKVQEASGATLFLCSRSQIKSSRIFWERFEAYSETLPELIEERKRERELERTRARRHVHNLVELNAKAIQSIYEIIPQETFIKESRDHLLDSVREFIEGRSSETAKLIVDLVKNETLKKTEFSVYNKIFSRKRPECWVTLFTRS